MDADSFRGRVERETESELDRLGSSELLAALTDADPTRESLLEAAAHSEHAARETFRLWAETATDDEVRAAFDDVAEQEDEHLRRVLGALDGADLELADGGPMHSYLRGRDDAVERVAGGMVGRPLVSLRTHGRLVSFFVGEADETTASLFRDLREETAAVVEDGVSLLAARCEGDDDWERARMVAEYTIRVAHDDYADALTEMGLNPESGR